MKHTLTSLCLAALTLPALADDPAALEKLRERLAEKLSSAKAHTTGDGMDLRVAAPAPAPAAAAVVSHGSTRRVAHTPASGPPAAAKRPPAASHWSYGGEAGPQTWGGLKPEFAMCSSGQRQSPIDIREGIAVDLEPVKFDYQPSGFSVVDNGHTVQVNIAPGNTIELNGKRFELKQFHFHRPSEERIDGRQFEMSAHFVHADAEGRLAVVGVLLAKGPAHPLVQTVWANLPLEKHSEQRARVLLDPAALLPADRRYYTYMGSLTTPPCSEGVQWVVMRSPVAASAEQIDIFSRLYPMNARPPQSAAGRRIMQSN
jgi:carbonic anhydrase